MITAGRTSSTSRKILPAELTSYDLLKSVAVILMIIDHAAYYFYPEALWPRAMGRTAFAMWFFLIGYARGRDIPLILIGGTLALVGANVVTGMSLLPVSALGTIIWMRLALDPFMKLALRGIISFMVLMFLLYALAAPTAYITEYGTQAFIIAIFGYVVRHKGEIENGRYMAAGMAVFSLLTFVPYQQALFHFDTGQLAFVWTGTAAVLAGLCYFRPLTFPRLTAASPAALNWALQFMGRHTLAIYVGHLIIFKFGALLLGDPRLGWFETTLFYDFARW